MNKKFTSTSILLMYLKDIDDRFKQRYDLLYHAYASGLDHYISLPPKSFLKLKTLMYEKVAF